MASAEHIVWDWNGTLLDDFAICLEAARQACQRVGGVGVDADRYRRHYTRPVRVFYDRLFRRPVTDPEWRSITEIYHTHYSCAVADARLRDGALEILERVYQQGITQSLLSMSEHDALVPLVRRHELDRWLVLVQGSARASRTESKRLVLREHLDEVGRRRGRHLDPAAVLLIGDALDDRDAAAQVGAACVLLDDGLFDPAALCPAGCAIAKDLRRAVEFGLATPPPAGGGLRPGGR
jgi:phosphoglycolate phosphatase-like HAD superfamily hydrolase